MISSSSEVNPSAR
jgi:hypothetical protein